MREPVTLGKSPVGRVPWSETEANLQRKKKMFKLQLGKARWNKLPPCSSVTITVVIRRRLAANPSLSTKYIADPVLSASCVRTHVTLPISA